MSRKIVAGFGLLLVGMGLWMFASPHALPEFAEKFLTPGGLGVAAALRITLGILLWAASDATRTPRVFKVLGILFVIGGLAIPVIGVQRMTALVDWGVAQGDGYMRGSALTALAMGAFFMWATLTRRNASSVKGDA